MSTPAHQPRGTDTSPREDPSDDPRAVRIRATTAAGPFATVTSPRTSSSTGYGGPAMTAASSVGTGTPGSRCGTKLSPGRSRPGPAAIAKTSPMTDLTRTKESIGDATSNEQRRR